MTLSLLLALTACPGDDTSRTSGDDHPSCDAYLACVEAAFPDQSGAEEAAYGPDGVCWGQGEDYDLLCEEACETALLAASHAYKDIDACEPGGGWVPEDGCPFEEGWWTLDLSDAGGDCFPDGLLDETLDAELACEDAVAGDFTLLIGSLFADPLPCTTRTYDFDCPDPSLELSGTFSHTEVSATGVMVIDGTDCESGATFVLER